MDLYSSSFDGHDDESSQEIDGGPTDGINSSSWTHAGDGQIKDIRSTSRHIPVWLSHATPDEFIVRLTNASPEYYEEVRQTFVVTGI